MTSQGLVMRGVVLVVVCALQCVHTTWWHLGLVGVSIQSRDDEPNGLPTRDKLLNIDIPGTSPCSDITYLEPKQREMCEEEPKVMNAIKKGAASGIGECQFQFGQRRWNCSIYNQTDLFGKIVNIKSRETAYLYSIFSAGVMHSITKACARGELESCGCDQKIKRFPPKTDFEWGGCSDNIRYSNRFSRDFVDIREMPVKTKAHGMMNLWNNEAGRRTVKQEMRKACKCHGVSASCTKKICWRTLKPFREIGTKLKAKFDGASKVKLNRRGRRLKPVEKQLKPPTKRDLVYLEESPDFCERNIKSGILGTHKRICNKTSQGLDGCTLMCCGRGYYTIVKTVVEDCDCKFFWCCRVECKKCKKIIEEHHCN